MIIINHFYYLYVYGFMEPKKWGSAGFWEKSSAFGRRVRGFAAGCAEGLRKKVLKMDRPVGRKVQRVLAVPLRAHYKKAPTGIYQPKRH